MFRLNIYTDPVTLICGHNFCRVCITRVLDTQWRSGGYSCPECREEFCDRSALQKNITLLTIMQNFLSAQQKSGVLCTYCIHTPVPAVKSCLHCEASLCDNHLKVHSKSPEHILCEPRTSLESRKCSVHWKIAEYYCTEDASIICVSCRLDGEHQGHRVETLAEASVQRKKRLANSLQYLKIKKEEREKIIQSLQECRGKVQEKVDGETKRVNALFRDLRRHLEDLEKRVLSEISGKAERVSLSMSDMIQELEIKKDELSRKIHHIEELCNMADPLTVLQESDTGDLCDTEDGDDRERHDKLLHDGGDVAGVSYTLHTGLADIIRGVNVEEYLGAQVFPHCNTKDKVHLITELPRSYPQPAPTVQFSDRQDEGANIGGIQQTWGVLGVTDILLDVSTADNDLFISDDMKSASRSYDGQNYPETPNRFQDYPQVLSSQSFSSGRHYWEVDVGGAEFWIVGMCYPSIERKERKSLIGYNRKSWGLERWYNQYLVIHGGNEIRLPSNISSNRVRIYLDYKAGRISFYDLCDPIQHLHTFITTFTEPLHAGLGVWEGHVKILGANHTRTLPRDL